MYDYLFLSTSLASPMMQQRIKVSIEGGYNPLYIYWNRNQFYPTQNSTNYKELSFAFPAKANFVRRFFILISFILWLRKRMKGQVKKGSICYCDSPDMLFTGMLAGAGFGFKYRYSLEDLHTLQLKAGVWGKVIRSVERIMLKRVDRLVLTSEAFWENYYSRFTVRDYVIVENVPLKSIWQGFERVPDAGGLFRIGFVGNIRYLECLFALVAASRIVVDKGYNIEVVFSGGGREEEVQALVDFCKNDSFVSFTGSYNYSRDIKNLYGSIHLIYSVYDTSLINVQLAMPNKFYESIISKIPMMVSSGTYLEKRVLEAGIGIGVNFRDTAGMAEVLEEAVKRQGWYRDAVETLKETDLHNYYYKTQTAAMKMAVL